VTGPIVEETTDADRPPIARLTVQGPGSLDPIRRQRLATWLRKQAHALEHRADEYTTGRYTARLHG
jgi:hypothetical protein